MLRNIVNPVSDAPEGEVEPSRRSRPKLVVVPPAPEAPVQPRRRGEVTLDVRTDAVVVELFDQGSGETDLRPKRGAARRERDPAMLLVGPGKPRIERIVEAEDDPDPIVRVQPIVQIFESTTRWRRRLSRSVELLLVGLVLGAGITLLAAVVPRGDNGDRSGRTLIETSIGEAVVVERPSIDADSPVSARSAAEEPTVASSGAPTAGQASVSSNGSAVADPPSGAVGDEAQVTSAP